MVAPELPPVPGQRSDVQRVARWTGELLSVAAVLSFLAGVWTNQLVFEQWGLSFLQVATVADVVMSGLALLSYGLSMSVILAVAYAVARQRRVRWLRWLLLAPACLLAGVGAASLLNGGTGSSAIVLGGTIITGLLLPSALHARRHPSSRGLLRLMLTAGLVAVTLAALVHSTVAAYARDGYGGDLLLVSPTLPGCAGVVLWSGERATVLSCEPLSGVGPPRRVMVVQQPEGWVFRRSG